MKKLVFILLFIISCNNKHDSLIEIKYPPFPHNYYSKGGSLLKGNFGFQHILHNKNNYLWFYKVYFNNKNEFQYFKLLDTLQIFGIKNYDNLYTFNYDDMKFNDPEIVILGNHRKTSQLSLDTVKNIWRFNIKKNIIENVKSTNNNIKDGIILGTNNLMVPSKFDAINSWIIDEKEIQSWRSLQNFTTAPCFVLIKVNKNDSIDNYCISADMFVFIYMFQDNKSIFNTTIEYRYNLLMKLLHNRNYNDTIKYDSKNIFLRKQYNNIDLACARQLIINFSNKDLLNNFNKINRYLFEEKLFKKSKIKDKWSFKYAMAHALYERGFIVGIGCESPSLWIKE
jgi:hypothetical protein